MMIFDLDDSGRPLVAIEKSTGTFQTVVSHNWCDNTTWEISTTDSTWDIAPGTGEIIDVLRAEIQFEHDLSMSSTVNLKYYAWVGGTPTVIRTISFAHTRDLFNYANEHYHSPSLPQITNGLSTLVFAYAHKLKLYGDDCPGKLAKLEVSIDDHTQLTGSWATIGFVTE